MHDTANWMQSLPDDRSIFHMLLPGTHDSTAHRADTIDSFSSQCQSEEFWQVHDQVSRWLLSWH
jgi:hypothetical protein